MPGLDADEIRSEIVRYVADPGQAVAYTVGLQQQVGFTQFSDGNQTSTILSPAVEAVASTGNGVDTTITFRSLQAAELGPDGQTCSDWRLRWRMVEVDGRWLVDDVDALDGSPYAC